MVVEVHPELRVTPFVNGLVLLYCDSTGAIAQAKEPKSYQCTKYILHRYHLVYEITDRDDIELQKIDGKENIADLFTQALEIKEFDDYK